MFLLLICSCLTGYEYCESLSSVEFAMVCVFFFFFQAEDGIRDVAVTGVQTCALPISEAGQRGDRPNAGGKRGTGRDADADDCGEDGWDREAAGVLQSVLGREAGKAEIGRASCRERV